jgi:hypothetical protein
MSTLTSMEEVHPKWNKVRVLKKAATTRKPTMEFCSVESGNSNIIIQVKPGLG